MTREETPKESDRLMERKEIIEFERLPFELITYATAVFSIEKGIVKIQPKREGQPPNEFVHLLPDMELRLNHGQTRIRLSDDRQTILVYIGMMHLNPFVISLDSLTTFEKMYYRIDSYNCERSALRLVHLEEKE